MLFTTRSIKELKVESGSQYFRDSRTKGLSLRVTKTVKSWYFIKVFNRKKHYHKIGKWPSVDLSDARKEVLLLQNLSYEELVEKSLPVAPAVKQKEEVSVLQGNELEAKLLNILSRLGGSDVSVALEAKPEVEMPELSLLEASAEYELRWMKQHLRPRTVCSYSDLFGQAAERLGNPNVYNINRSDLKKLFRTIAEVEGKPTKANRMRSALSSMYKWLLQTQDEIGDQFLTQNPCLGLIKYKENIRERNLSNQELKVLFPAIIESNCRIEVRVGLLLFLLTAVRLNAMVGMCWQEIDWEAKTWLVPSERSKNKKEFVVALSDLAISILKRLHSGQMQGYVFRDSIQFNRKINRHAFLQGLKRLLAQYKIPDCTVHDLRRTAATQLGSLGFDSYLIGKVLSHTDSSVTARYNRFDYLEQKREAVETLANHYLSLGLTIDSLPYIQAEVNK